MGSQQVVIRIGAISDLLNQKALEIDDLKEEEETSTQMEDDKFEEMFNKLLELQTNEIENPALKKQQVEQEKELMEAEVRCSATS